MQENRSFLPGIMLVNETVSELKGKQIKYLDLELKCDTDRFVPDTVHAIIRLHQPPLDCFDLAIDRLSDDGGYAVCEEESIDSIIDCAFGRKQIEESPYRDIYEKLLDRAEEVFPGFDRNINCYEVKGVEYIKKLDMNGDVREKLLNRLMENG